MKRAFLIAALFPAVLLFGCLESGPDQKDIEWCLLCKVAKDTTRLIQSTPSASPYDLAATPSGSGPEVQAGPPERRTAFQVNVTDENGSPLEGVAVTSFREGTLDPLETTYTDASGMAEGTEGLEGTDLEVFFEPGIYYMRDWVKIQVPGDKVLTVRLNRSTYEPDTAWKGTNYSGWLKRGQWLELPHGIRLTLDQTVESQDQRFFAFSVYDTENRWVEQVELEPFSAYEGKYVTLRLQEGEKEQVRLNALVNATYKENPGTT